MPGILFDKLPDRSQRLLGFTESGKTDALAEQRVGAQSALSKFLQEIIEQSDRGLELPLIQPGLRQVEILQFSLELLISRQVALPVWLEQGIGGFSAPDSSVIDCLRIGRLLLRGIK